MPSAVYHTVATIADSLAVKEEKVLYWINAGELGAIDVSERRASRPRWRIPATALESFLAARSTTPPSKAPRRKKQTGVIEFF